MDHRGVRLALHQRPVPGRDRHERIALLNAQYKSRLMLATLDVDDTLRTELEPMLSTRCNWI